MSAESDALDRRRGGHTGAVEPEHDEIRARAASFRGPAVVAPDELDGVPLVQLSGRTATPRIAAGPRGSRPAAATLGAVATTRHNWTSLGPRNISGRIRALACVDPTVAGPTTWYAGSAGGGVWKSTDGGHRWATVWHDQPCMEIAALAAAPAPSRRVYAATGEAVPASQIAIRSFGVFVSNDDGATWDNHGANAPNPDAPRGFEAIAVDPADDTHCWAVGPDGAFRTTNAGVDWIPLDAGTHYTDVAFAGARLFLVLGTSTDGAGRVVRLGTPKTAVDADLRNAANRSVVLPARPAHLTWPVSGKIAVAPSRPATVYVRWAGEDGRHLGIFRSLNAGNVNVGTIGWDRLPDDPAMRHEEQGDYDLVLAVDPTDPSNVVTGQQLYLFASTNADTTTIANVRWRRIMSWELRNEGLDAHLADFHHVVLAGNPVECWAAADGGIARSLDWRTAGAPTHGLRFLEDPARPAPPGAVRWEKRDHGIGGAQFYDVTQHGLLPGLVAGGLQDNGTVLRPGGLTWQRIFVADGGHAVFDPDDPYRMHISYFAGLVALQFPALLDRLFPGSSTAEPSLTFRFVDGDVTDGSPFVPETERHPNRAGRLLHARDSRVWGMHGGQGERMTPESLGRSFELRVLAPPPPPPGPPPPPPAAPTDITIGDTQGAWRLGLVPGRYVRPGRGAVLLRSRVPAPYTVAEGDTLALTINGAAFVVTFNAAAGIAVGAVTITDVVNLVSAAVPAAVAGQLEVRPAIWGAPSAVLLVAHDAGAAGARQIALGGTALDATADGLSRLGLNAGTYVGDAHGAAVVFGFAGLDLPEQRINRDLSAAPTLSVGINGAAPVDVALSAASFADPARITAGQLADVIRAGLAGQPVDVHAVPLVERVNLLAAPGARVRLTGTAADRIAAGTHGASSVSIGFTSLAARHAGNHVRNRSSLDLRPVPAAGPALQLVIGDGANNTGPLQFTAANCASLRSVTAAELNRLITAHLAAHPAVRVTSELQPIPIPDSASEIRFSPVDDDDIWVGLPDGTVLMTADDGVSWTDVTDPAMRRMDRPVEAIACHPTQRQTIYVGLSGDGAAAGDPGFLFKTTTGAPPWQQIGFQVVGGANTGVVTDGRPLGVTAIELDPTDPEVVYVGTEAGVFRSPDGGTTWAPFGEGLPNAPVVDLAVEPVTPSLRAAMWTRGVHERRLDGGPPDDARLVVRATALDDGTRPARAAPSFHTSAPAPLLLESPDIKHVVRRPAVGADAQVDGVAFDLLVRHDDVVAGAAAEVMVQVANLGALAVPPGTPPPPGDRARVVVLWAPVDGGTPPLPADLWMRLTAGPLAGAVGAWTVLGDGAVARVIGPGDTGVASFAVNWPALDGVRRLGLLAIATAVADPVPAGPLEVSTLVGVERRVAYREVAVRTAEADRTLVLRATEARDIIVEDAVAPAGTGVAGRLGLAGVVGAGARVRVGAPAAAATYDLSVAAAAPGPAIALRTAAPIPADLALAPPPGEVDDITAVTRGELAAMITRRAAAVGLPIEAFNPPVGFAIVSRHGVTFRVTGGNAAPRLGLAVGGAAADFVVSNVNPAWFDLTGRPNLNLEFILPGEPNVAVAVNLAAANFPNVAVADPEIVVALLDEALAAAQLSALVECFAIIGLGVRGRGQARVQLSGPAAAAGVCDFPAAADRVVVSVPAAAVDLTAGPNLHVDLTPEVTVRFDADPSDIPDLASARPADVRRAINDACELASVPVRAEAPSIELRVAASPGDVGRRHPTLGGAHLAELAVVGLGQAADATLFQVRTVLGIDELETGVANPLAVRIRNAGNVECATGRLRLVRLDLAAPPQVGTNVVVTEPNLVLPAAGSLIHPLTWDPALPAGATTVVMVVVDDDRPGRQIAIPPTFATLEEAIAFASARPDVALRSFRVRDP